MMDVLGSGMEGVTYALGDGRVAKVWSSRTEAGLRPLIDFYAELGGLSLPFATPEIHEVSTVDGRAVTIERHLPGVPLSAALAGGAVDVRTAQECALAVLEALAGAIAGPAARALPVFGEPLWSSADAGWISLLHRRLALFGAQLRPVVDRFDAKVERVAALLSELPPDPGRVVHGDLCLPNILVDAADGRVLAVLDWGFLSTAGDPAFDASTFAGFFDMYGPEARQRDDELTAMICARLGHPRELLLLYRAFYALIGSNAYSPTGDDGHFQWCVATLNRGDISGALLR